VEQSPSRSFQPAPFTSWAAWFWPAAGLCLVLDQASKWWLQAQVGPHGGFGGEFPPGWPSWLHWSHNTGVAWSMFHQAPVLVAVLTAVLIPVLIWIWWRQYRLLGRWENLAFGGVLGGAVGNGIDRLLAQTGTLAGVRDFIHVDLGFWPFHPWPTFNVADAGITGGFIILLLLSLQRPKPGAPVAAPQTSAEP
jgi:signal peptidase II